MSDEDNWPEMGEMLVCTIKTVKQNGVYVDLGGYPGKEGFVFIGEIASGWVKNIRSHVREGQRVVAKAVKVRKDRQSIELSIKSVSEERRRDALQRWKNEQRAGQLLRIVGERSGWDEDKTKEIQSELVETYGGLYSSFEETAIDNDALSNEGFEGDWIELFIETAIENIIPDFVVIRAIAEIEIHSMEGVELIRNALTEVENCSSKEDEVEISCYYDGAPEYRIELKAPDWEIAEKGWSDVELAISTTITEDHGSAVIIRE
ncbi:MAG: translation initiation factor IF-2 subunit alpha [Candidatus Thalassarchaeaceae archaeon]|jgi:translation initiation factor 2 subunit 1|nr:translation initiation factor IF-2 subunit alpha [Candidatus Thalassarchaeaceae archaeon]